jgi:DNA sulfur modification protein DndD
MILSKVRLFNVGAFRGAHEMELAPTKNKPVVLIGGMNGAGKTTLFNSVLLCLYGRGWEAPQSAVEYENQLRSMTHREAERASGRDAYIEVTFTHTHLGEEQQYAVRRSWKVNPKSVVETVEVKEGGKPPSDVDPDYWNQFIRELIPRGVSNLFFFDGEKVKDLASDDEAHAIALRDAFDSLLGLDVVEQLRLDLAHVISSQRSDTSHELTSEVETRTKAIRDKETEITKLRKERDELKGNVERFRAEADRWEAELSRSGGIFATKREEYKAKEAELEKAIKEKQAVLTDLASGALPFILAPGAVRSYLNRIRQEQDAVKAQAASEAVATIQRSLRSRFSNKQAKLNWFRSDEGSQSALRALDEAFKPFLETPALEVLHGYSTNEADSIISELGHRLPQGRETAAALATELKKLRAQLKHVHSFLSKVPDDAEHQAKIHAVLQKLGDAARKTAHFEASLAEKQHQLEGAKGELERIISDRDALDAKLRKATHYVSSIHRAAACRDALKDYQDRLRAMRRETLQHHLVECLGLLTNKDGTYKHIQLDEHLRLSVNTREGKSLDFTELSAGERQVLATALLWALSRTSGRPLPFVIDTPLGRLDSKHRGQLVERFYPQAGHQVIILSTDTEIHDKYAKQLKDHVGRTYLLHYDAKTEQTTVKSGYFGGAV